jgi:hypothetical protein
VATENQHVGLERFDSPVQQRNRQPAQILSPRDGIDEQAGMPQGPYGTSDGRFVLVPSSGTDDGDAQGNLGSSGW